MKRHMFIVVLLVLGAFVFISIPSINSEEEQETSVEVLIDFGNGIVEWAEVTLITNRTAFNATEEACAQLNLNLVVTWYEWGDDFVPFINEIGGYSVGWLLWTWNNTLQVWEFSWEAASAIQLNEGDIIGWCPYPSTPIATPTTRYPWAGFRHDAFNSGHSKGAGPSDQIPSWIYDTGTVEMPSSPVIVDGKVIVNNWGGVYCLDEEDELLWKNGAVKAGFSPAISDGKVFVGGKDGYLYSLNLTDGTIIWSTEISEHPGLSGVPSSPTIVNNKVFIGSFDFSGGEGYLYCLDKESGNVLWKSQTDSSVYFSSPSVLEDRVYIGTMGLYDSSTMQWNPPFGLYCLDAENGDLLWNFSVDGSVGSSPTVADDRILFTSKDGYLYSLNATDGDLVWRRNIGSSVSSPALWQGAIFVGAGEMNSNGKFYSFGMDGNKLWEFEPNGAVQSSPAIAKDKVYFATNVQSGAIYCLNQSTGDLVWQYMPLPEQFIISSPAIADGKLFIGSDNGRLYCFADGPPQITVDATGTTQVVNAGGGVKFVHKGGEHKVILTSITANSVNLKITSTAQIVDVNVDETKNIDTDGNGKNDLSIKVNSVDTTAQTASFTFKSLTEPEDQDGSALLILLLVIIVLVIIVVGFVIALKR